MRGFRLKYNLSSFISMASVSVKTNKVSIPWLVWISAKTGKYLNEGSDKNGTDKTIIERTKKHIAITNINPLPPKLYMNSTIYFNAFV